MADVKDKHFLRGEVRDMFRVGVPALQKMVEGLQARITALENPIGTKKDMPVPKSEPEKKAESAPKKRSRKKK